MRSSFLSRTRGPTFARPRLRLAWPAMWAMLLVIVLATAASPAQAQWKWRDRTGQINASDRAPPLDIPEKDILARPAPEPRRVFGTAAPASAAASASVPTRTAPADRELEAKRRASDQEQASKAKAEEEKFNQQRAENCRRARGHLAALESGQRIARVNEKGEREVLDDRGLADELRQARSVIASDCR